MSRPRSRASHQPVPDAPRPPAPGPDAHPPCLAETWVRLARLAGQLGVDPRTLKKHLAGQPFVQRLGSHVTLVDRRAFEAWRQTRRG
jgi:hypothetical protein